MSIAMDIDDESSRMRSLHSLARRSYNDYRLDNWHARDMHQESVPANNLFYIAKRR